VDWWIGGLVDWWIGGLVDWWIGGLVDWWIGGLGEVWQWRSASLVEVARFSGHEMIFSATDSD
jgi:hypothetical protein